MPLETFCGKDMWSERMKRYIINRLITTIFIILGAAVLIFTILYFVPGDPARIILGSEASEADVLAKREILGLTDSYFVRLGNFLKDTFLHFDLGTSWFTDVSVNQELAARLPRTLFLGVMFVVVSSAIAIPLGISAAIHQNKWQDRLCMVIAMVLTAVPNFWLALIMVLIFSLRLGWLPPFGMDSWQCFILPVLAASLSFIGLGIQPPTPEWGAMLTAGRSTFRNYPWQILFPGILIFLTVLSINLFGDGLRDALDPKMKK